MSEGKRTQGGSDDPLGEDRSDEFISGGEPETDVVEFSPEFNAAEVPRQKGGIWRLLLALVLVVALVGGGFYLLGQTLYTAPPVAVPKVTKMKVPVRQHIVLPAEGVKEEVVPAENVAAIVEKKPAVPKKNKKIVMEPAVVNAAFWLKSPDYLYAAEAGRVSRRLEKLGYTVEQTVKSEPHEMTRLLVGRYGRSLAQKRLAEIKKKSAGAFLVAEQGKFVVYAGSYLSLDKARRQADLLYQKGVRSEEKQVKVDLPRTTLHFGRFATQLEARRSLERLKKIGIKGMSIVPFK